jgi:TRAP-type C4-dicarboxylate transport system substrate-binding protein
MEMIMFNKAIKTGLCAAVALAVSGEVLAEQWDVSLWGKQRAFTEHVEKLAELVSAKTGGEFTLNISYGGLSKNKENLDGISIGAFQMAQFCAGYHRDKNPSITVLELPFLGVSTLEQERSISQAVYQHPAVQKDLARWNATLLMPSPLPQYNIVGVGDAPKTLSDYEGLSVRATGGIGQAMAAVGAVPTSMSASEVRQALDSGVVKAVAFAPHAHMSFGTVEAGKWWTTNLNPGTVNCPVVVNSDALADLSDDHRNALLGSVDEALDHYIATYNGKTMNAWGPTLEAKGIESVSYTEAELSAFRSKVAGPAAAAWIEENTAKGLPAQELYDLVTGLISK